MSPIQLEFKPPDETILRDHRIEIVNLPRFAAWVQVGPTEARFWVFGAIRQNVVSETPGALVNLSLSKAMRSSAKKRIIAAQLLEVLCATD